MFPELDELLRRRNQRFICTDTGWPQPGPKRHAALIEHLAEPPLDAAALARLRAHIGDMPEVLAFYARHGGLTLYRDTVASGPIGHATAFRIAPPSAWGALRVDFDEWIEQLDAEERDTYLPEWLDDAVVIGEIPNSGNCFLLAIHGPEQGRVYEFSNDGFEFIERATSFAGFVRWLSVVDEALLHTISGYTRYADGSTSVQWLCREYAHDGAAPG